MFGRKYNSERDHYVGTAWRPRPTIAKLDRVRERPWIRLISAAWNNEKDHFKTCDHHQLEDCVLKVVLEFEENDPNYRSSQPSWRYQRFAQQSLCKYRRH